MGHLGLVWLTALGLAAPGATRLGIEGTRFTLNGEPKFLLGISYYGALAAPDEFLAADLDDMVRAGFNWLRVWALWGFFDQNLAAVNPDGSANEVYLPRLRTIVAEADRRGLVVDVTFIHAGERAGQPTMLVNLAAHQRAVETVATALKPFRNVYFDLANERSIQSKYVSYEDLKILRDAVKAIDPQRLLTASDTGELTREKLTGYLTTAKLDFLTPHRPRSSQSARQNKARCEETLKWLAELGLTAPVHYQEPFRRGFTRGWEPTVEDFLADLDGAVAGGAAGWCLHNGDERYAEGGRPRRSFDLRPAEGRLFDQLDPVERQVVAAIAKRFARPGD